MKVGDVEVLSAIDGRIISRLWSSKPLPEVQTAEWQQQHGMMRADGLIESTIGGFFILTGNRVVLVDAGAGQKFPNGYRPLVVDADDASDPLASAYRDRGLPDDVIRQLAADFAQIQIEQGALPESMRDLGLAPEDVTDVVFTHLHYDHIGWASVGGEPYFPNATYRCAAQDLDYFMSDPPEEKTVSQVFQAMKACDRLAPVADRIVTWDHDGPLMPGVNVRLAPGHTPGSSVVVISDSGAQAMLLGDIVHCPLELTDDDFDLFADHDAVAAAQVRRAYARELEGGAIPAAAAHFPGLAFGRLLSGPGVRSWRFE
jgi:glyoxylase-like metal-dependent hydrolase (beta-lactamase superfamily II)